MESIEKIVLSRDGYFGGTDTYTITFSEQGIATIKKEEYLKIKGNGEYCITLPETDSTRLLLKIKTWDVQNWKGDYLNPCVMDGEQWDMAYKIVGKRNRKYGGSNDYPPTWARVLATLAWLDFLYRETKATYGYITRASITIKTQTKSSNVKRCEAEPEYLTIEDIQQIQINRNRQSIRTKYTMGKTKFEGVFNVPDGVSDMLNELSEIVRLHDWRAFVPEAQYDENNYCEVELFFTKSEPVRFKTTYVPEQMPYGWFDFSNVYNDFVKTNPNPATISNGKFYHRFEEGMLIYCSCLFNESGDTYYYRTEDRTIEEGDEVVVPVGTNNREEVVLVDAVDYFKPKDVPFPIEKTKMIIRKVKDD